MPEKQEWDHQQLEDLITVVKTIMPVPEAQMVIATTLLTACLATVSETLEATVVSVDVQQRKEAAWNDARIDFEIDGVKLTLEVKTRD